MAGDICIAEVEEIVDELDPDHVHLPGVYVKRLVLGEYYEKRIIYRTVSDGSNYDIPGSEA